MMLSTSTLILANNEQPKPNENLLKTQKTTKEDSNKTKPIIVLVEEQQAGPDTSHCWAMSIPLPLGPGWEYCIPGTY